MGTNQRYHFYNSFFSSFFFDRKMRVALFFLLVIIASVQVGNACNPIYDDDADIHFVGVDHLAGARMENPQYSQEKHGWGQEKRQKEAIGLIESLSKKGQRMKKAKKSMQWKRIWR